MDLTVRLACALRFFAGGEAYDISVMFGVSHSSVFESIDIVVEAINKCKQLHISFPRDHGRQREIARGFRAKSPTAHFNRVVGCIDGMLIWMHKPSQAECEEEGVDETKFFCGRKHKFGLNLQAVCDHKRRFLEINLDYGAASSDQLAFEVTRFRQLLEQEGFLANGLVLFG